VSKPPPQESKLNRLNDDMCKFAKHKRDKKRFTYNAIACSDYLSQSFSGIKKIQAGEYEIQFPIFFNYFNMFRYFCNCQPIKYESVQELFRESKSDWKKKHTNDGHFVVTLKGDPTQIPIEEPRNSILDRLLELQKDELKKKQLQERIKEMLSNDNKKKRVSSSKPKRKSASRQKPSQANPSLDTNVVAVQEPAMSETYVPPTTRKRRQEERTDVQPPAKYHCTEKQTSTSMYQGSSFFQ